VATEHGTRVAHSTHRAGTAPKSTESSKQARGKRVSVAGN
jgi:hypothetical protein